MVARERSVIASPGSPLAAIRGRKANTNKGGAGTLFECGGHAAAFLRKQRFRRKAGAMPRRREAQLREQVHSHIQLGNEKQKNRSSLRTLDRHWRRFAAESRGQRAGETPALRIAGVSQALCCFFAWKVTFLAIEAKQSPPRHNPMVEMWFQEVDSSAFGLLPRKCGTGTLACRPRSPIPGRQPRAAIPHSRAFLLQQIVAKGVSGPAMTALERF